MVLVDYLSFLGKHARLCLPLGLFVALILPDLGEQVRQMLPLIIIIIYASAMVRLDLGAAIRGRFSRIAFSDSWPQPYNPYPNTLSVCCHRAQFWPSRNLYASPHLVCCCRPSHQQFGCVCFRFQTCFGNGTGCHNQLDRSFTGPFVSSLFMGTITALDPFELFVRLGVMIIAGGGVALLGQWFIGNTQIDKHHTVFDGISTLAMLAFLIPVFNGVSMQISASLFLPLSFWGWPS